MFLTLLILLILSTVFFGFVLVTNINSNARLVLFVCSALLLAMHLFR